MAPPGARELTNAEVAALAEAGMSGLRGGDAAAARRAFERLVQAGRGDASVFFGLAHACQRQGDAAAAVAAIDSAIEHDPRNPQLLATKADWLHAAGDSNAAQFYRTALKACAEGDQAQLAPVLDHVRMMLRDYEARFQQALDKRLAGLDPAPDAPNRRFRQSLELVLGKRKLYFQQPRMYYYPGLPHIEFFDRADFPWLAQLEAHTAAIRAEVMALLDGGEVFEPYMKGDPSRPTLNRGGLHNNRDWGAFYLWQDGAVVERNAARCPATMAALEHIPLPRIEGRSPNVLFSLMRPGTHIPPHTGVVNTRLIGHLPLIVPEGCQLRVGNEVRTCREGQAWLFDDSIEHEAWNRSDQLRVILLFEVWRPELGEDERALVADLLHSIVSARGGGADWDM
jgi:aspartyl/asparaginyl beta-hydroxylase (cupin superfamily)